MSAFDEVVLVYMVRRFRQDAFQKSARIHLTTGTDFRYKQVTFHTGPHHEFIPLAEVKYGRVISPCAVPIE